VVSVADDTPSGTPCTPTPGVPPLQSRRDFLRRVSGASYVVPAVFTLSISSFYDEETGYAMVQAATPPGWEHHTHGH